MIPLPFWLANVQFVLGAFGFFAFFATAWLNIDAWAVRREARTGLKAIGFALLAAWSALHGIGIPSPVMGFLTALLLAGGIGFALVGFFLDPIPLAPKELAAFRKHEERERTRAAPLRWLSGRFLLFFPQPRFLTAGRGLYLRAIATGVTLGLGVVIVGAVIYFLITIVGGPAENPAALSVPAPAGVSSPAMAMPVSLRPSPTGPPPAPRAVSVTVQETGLGFLNVRAEPNTNGRILTAVKPGESYVLREERGEWVKILLSPDTGLEGWVSAQHVKKGNGGDE